MYRQTSPQSHQHVNFLKIKKKKVFIYLFIVIFYCRIDWFVVHIQISIKTESSRFNMTV